MSLTVRSAAKINLMLGVGAPRPDGFHTLVTVYQAISLYDDLMVTAAGELTVETHAADHVSTDLLPPPGQNIVDRAAAVLSAHHGRDVTGHVNVDKAIPIAGGLAGGSADAAAALVGLDRLHDLRTTDDDLLALAARLGSDVPFALLGGTALGLGHGELLTSVADHGSWWWVVVPNPVGMSTPAVYARFDELNPDAPADPGATDVLLEAVASGDAHRLAAALRNDLEPAAFDLRSELVGLIERGRAAGALRGLVSGSGPTCVFLCESGHHARTVAATLNEPVVLVAHGPVAGAHVVT